MKVLLALETTERIGSIALFSEERLLESRSLPGEQRTAESLVPTIESSLKARDLTPESIDAIAVTIGPGSFTGLRIGITAAKTLAYVTGARVYPISTLEAIAANFHRPTLDKLPDETSRSSLPEEAIVSVAVDAQRRQVMCRAFSTTTLEPQDREDETTSISGSLRDFSDWIDKSVARGAWLAGPVLQKGDAQLPEGARVSDPTNWTPRARVVGALALERWRNRSSGNDVWSLVPVYSRKSAAEEKWHRTHGAPFSE
jgi:tRNA threonylcarbamoyladenosine biosynthesis protein TsaB